MAETEGSWTIEGLGDVVSQPHQYAGGGAVAAMSLVGAAATAELVFQLSSRRRSLSQTQKDRLEAAIEQIRALRAAFLRAIDSDIESLTELMEAQRGLRNARKTKIDLEIENAAARMQRAVKSAISTPLGVAREAAQLLDTIAELHAVARPFTASDLGAAAATIQGAITSLLLMAEVNLGMVDAAEEVKQLQRELDDLSRSSAEQAQEVISSTRRVIYEETDRGT